MNKRVLVLMLVMLVGLAAGCNRNDAANTNATANANTTTTAPDNSEITTNVDANHTSFCGEALTADQMTGGNGFVG